MSKISKEVIDRLVTIDRKEVPAIEKEAQEREKRLKEIRDERSGIEKTFLAEAGGKKTSAVVSWQATDGTLVLVRPGDKSVSLVDVEEA